MMAALACSRSCDGLDDEQVDAALEQALGRELVAVALVGEADLAERRQLGAGPERARHPVLGAVAVGHLAGDAGRLPDSSKQRSAMPYSASTHGMAPNVLVSTTSTPTSKNDRCRSAMTSGRVTHRISGQPSNWGPPKSSMVRSRACRLVPVAPSKTTTRSATESRKLATGGQGYRGPVGSPAKCLPRKRATRRSTRARATTAPPASTSAAGCPRTTAASTPTARSTRPRRSSAWPGPRWSPGPKWTRC